MILMLMFIILENVISLVCGAHKAPQGDIVAYKVIKNTYNNYNI